LHELFHDMLAWAQSAVTNARLVTLLLSCCCLADHSVPLQGVSASRPQGGWPGRSGVCTACQQPYKALRHKVLPRQRRVCCGACCRKQPGELPACLCSMCCMRVLYIACLCSMHASASMHLPACISLASMLTSLWLLQGYHQHSASQGTRGCSCL
jgi:hypothetical protein